MTTNASYVGEAHSAILMVTDHLCVAEGLGPFGAMGRYAPVGTACLHVGARRCASLNMQPQWCWFVAQAYPNQLVGIPALWAKPTRDRT